MSKAGLRLACASLLLAAGSPTLSAPVPDTNGWHELAGTKLRSVCPSEPSIQGVEGCSAVTEDWAGATFDTKRDRLLVWGGGHAGYHGNEVYALNVGAGTIQRLNNPSLSPPSSCGNDGTMPDGNPVARHTYNHLAYIAHADRMFAFGGSASPCGFMKNDTWTFDLAQLKWQKMNPSGPTPEGNYGWVTAYDPATRKVFLHDYFNLFTYTFETNTYAIVKSNSGAISQNMTGAIDTKRKQFVMVGAGAVIAYDIAAGGSFARQNWQTSGATSIVNGSFIGLAYDVAGDRFVAWNGGNSVYSLNPDTKVWSQITNANGPGSALMNGTYGRFAYSSATGAFVVINSVDNNAFGLRLGPPPIKPNPPTDVEAH
jgi:hypothetical protein